MFASAYWALLPLIARGLLGGGPELYGILLGCVGAGAVGGALFLPKLKALLGPDRLVAAGTLGMALVLVVLATIANDYAAAAVSLLAGASWIAVLSSLNVSAQVALPEWVRARGLSIFLTVFFGAMSAGSITWGRMAEALGIPLTLLAAAAGPFLRSGCRGAGSSVRGQRSISRPPCTGRPPWPRARSNPTAGPVMVTVGTVSIKDRKAFLAAIAAFGPERWRDGAFAWGIFEDAAEEGRFIETFMVESWIEHLRQHERVTDADRVLQEAVQRFHAGGKPTVTHLIAAELRAR